MSNQLTRKLNSLVWPTQILNQEVNLKPVDKMIYLKKDKKKFLHEITLKCFNAIKLDLILFQLILVMNRNLKRIYIFITH